MRGSREEVWMGKAWRHLYTDALTRPSHTINLGTRVWALAYLQGPSELPNRAFFSKVPILTFLLCLLAHDW